MIGGESEAGEADEADESDESDESDDGPGAAEAAAPAYAGVRRYVAPEGGEHDADFWLRGRCDTCGTEAVDSAMKRCHRCGSMNHPACAKQAPCRSASSAW